MRALTFLAVLFLGCGGLSPDYPHSACAPAERGTTRCDSAGWWLCEPSTAPCLPNETDGGNCTVYRPEVIEHDVWVKISATCAP